MDGGFKTYLEIKLNDSVKPWSWLGHKNGSPLIQNVT